MEDHIIWLNAWQAEISGEVEQLEQEKNSCIEKQEALLKHLPGGKKKLADDQKQKINAEFGAKIQAVKNKFLSETTAEGLRITLRSTIDLSRYLLENSGFKFVLTRKLNQDCLEV